ncbi:MAG: S9 family peptidase [Vicinamibacteria bacterium]
MLRHLRIAPALALLAAVAIAPAAGAQQPLTLDDVYDPQKKADWAGQAPTGLVWASDTHYVHFRPEAGGGPRAAGDWLRVEALSGKSAPLFDAAAFEAGLTRVPGASAVEARRLARSKELVWNDAYTALVVELVGDLWHWRPGQDRPTRLTATPGREEQAGFSPDGTLLAFVRENDLYVVELSSQREVRLTRDGSADVLNGRLDWVYEEEIYGRGKPRGYWWSPDSRMLAFLRLDERDVPRYTLVDDRTTRPLVESWPYPKAGDANAQVRLATVAAAGGPPSFVDLSSYANSEILVVDVSWTPDSQQVVYQVQDREQTWLDLLTAGPGNGSPRRLFRETTRAWVDNNGSPRWLERGASFLWFSERSGFKHLYHYKADGSLIRQLTDGRWEARTLHGVDEKAGLVYFSGTERSPIGGDVYRIKLDGSGLQRLSERAGTHAASFNPSLGLYLDSWSDAMTATQARLHRADGTLARVVSDAPLAALSRFRLSKPEFLQVKTRDGFEMEAMLIKPPDFHPSRKYPVYQHTYGGPHSQQVKDAWGGATFAYHQLLAQKGIVVWICDNRTASGKGAESTWPGYQRLGELELQDVEDGLAWLRQQPWVDAERIGINGWSYGGFMVSYALTHSKSFAMGIAGGPVTDWRNYDSVYTERYMRTPQSNPDGYRRTAPQAAAADLHGRLLLVHGQIDDNVHPQNTLQFAYALQQAGKPFRMMFYPRSRHGVTDPAQLKHLRGTMLAFVEETLLAKQP